MKRLIAVAFAGLLLAACAHNQPIKNFVNEPMPASAQAMPLSEIERTIVAAGQKRNWRFESLGKGKLRAVQDHPKYAAEVLVTFDQKTYSLNYVTSRGFEEKDGTIHKHYNAWVHNLKSDIDSHLANAAFRAK